MDKNITGSNFSEEVNEWFFPKMEVKRESEKLLDEIRKQDQPKPPVKSEEQIKLEQDLAELDRQKQACQQQYNLLTSILTKLNEPLAVIDDSLIDLFTDIIKGAIKNIINKEIKANPALLTKMVDDLKELLHDKGGLINLFLSESDAKQFQYEGSDLMVKTDPELRSGDIVIKSNYAEIRMLLSERLDKMLGSKK